MKNLLPYGILLCCLAWPGAMHAQDAQWSKKDQQKLDKAAQYQQTNYYAQAIELYGDVWMRHKDSVKLAFQIASIYLKLHDYRQASFWYSEVLDKNSLPNPVPYDPIHLYNYAELLLRQENTADALYWYRAYQLNNPDDGRSASKMAGVQQIPTWKQQADRYEIKAVTFNSEYADFSPAFYDNGLVFVSGRAEKEGSHAEATEGAEYLDLYYATDAGVTPFSNIINTSLHEGPAVFYDHNSRCIFTRNHSESAKKSSTELTVIHLQLFETEKDTATGQWVTPRLLSIDKPEYSMGHPAINQAGTKLYLSSDKPGGYGGTDLYVTEWRDGAWSPMENLGSQINTEGDEMFPTIYGDTVLFFASNGHPGMGGLDLYRVNLQQQKVENLGYPINGANDDFGMIMAPDALHGFFSSDRLETNAAQAGDIFSFTIKTTPPPAPAVVQEDIPLPDSVLEVYYTVQILALKRQATVEKSFIQDLQGVLKHVGKDGLQRYTYGTYQNLQDAIVQLERIRAKGYTDAFVRREERYKELSVSPGAVIYEE